MKNGRILIKGLVLIGMLAVAGCTNNSVQNLNSVKSKEPEQKESVTKIMASKNMDKNSPIMMRVFKEEGVLEVWKKTRTGRYDIVSSYDICVWSGKLGPKYAEGDRQAPEGFYNISQGSLNPNSQYHLSFNMGFPNAYDKVNGRYGSNLMVHGACSSAGCYSMENDQIEEIYAHAKDAFKGGQRSFQVQAFPFRMTDGNMKRYSNDNNIKFWTMLKEGYDYFETTKTPPKVDVCEKKYVFNRKGTPLSPLSTCPSEEQSQVAISYVEDVKEAPAFKSIFSSMSSSSSQAPLPSINGFEEAAVVAHWSQKRLRGERVSKDPPDLNQVSKAYVEQVMRPVKILSDRMARSMIKPINQTPIASSDENSKYEGRSMIINNEDGKQTVRRF